MTRRTRPAAPGGGRQGSPRQGAPRQGARRSTRQGSGRKGPRQGGATVSAISAKRFAARSRARRRQGRRPLALLLVLLVLAGVVGWLGWASPFLTVRTVEVTGTRVLDRDAVLRAARIRLDTPLLRLDPEAARERVAGLPRVRDARVHRRWPHQVLITVTERQAAAVVRVRDGFVLVDRDGVSFATVVRRPHGLPLVVSEGGRTTAASLRAAIQVVRALPAGIVRRVVSVRAGTPDAIVLDLAGGISVMWGSAGGSDRKAEVLAALMRQPAGVYDVSAPDAPTIRARL